MMEKIIISYAKGITHSPSDLICTDGELEDCVNIEVRNEELVPMEMPVKLPFSLDAGERLVLIHNTKTGPKNYVTWKDDTVRIFIPNGSGRTYYDFTLNCGSLSSIQSVGNAIVIYTAESPYYILFNGENYDYLGNKLPEVGISFDLSGTFEVSETFEFTTPDKEITSDEYQESVVQQIMGEVNKFVEDESVSKGKFMFPFFVRYALRLFDGTHVMHSSPVLMLPSTNIAPYVVSYSDMKKLEGKTFKGQIGAFVANLEATISYLEGSVSDWSDIVTGIDVFVSRQIYTYDQNGTKFGNAALSMSKFIGKYNGTSTVWDAYSKMVNHTTLQGEEGEYLHRWYIPSREAEDVSGEIVNTSLFYKYTSIDLDDATNGNVITLSGLLSALETGEVLKDDYMTHDVLVPGSSFVYNGRLNISNIRRKLFSGFRMQAMEQMVKNATKDGFSYGLNFGQYQVYTCIKSPNGGPDIVVRSDTSSYGSMYGSYLFYPDTDAYKMVIVDIANSRHCELKLEEHPSLNGAYAFIGFQALGFVSGNPYISTTDNTEVQANKLYVSNVNNLFHFPLEGIYTVGSDRIIGMAAVTKPISQGQFGEFPLIVFCSDGNYALRVDELGFYSSISPVQEDVVLGSDKITPLENSVAIITKKGVMITAGGDMTKIAGRMDGGVKDYSSMDSIGTQVGDLSNLVKWASDNTGFLSYAYGARMSFDYASNRLLVFRNDKTYSYIYNFDNDTVSKLVLDGGCGIVSSVMDYPDSIIQDSSGILYSLYTKEDVSTKTSKNYGFVLTRPMKFGAALSMKSIRQVIHLYSNVGNGSFVKYNLYGSNDNVNYYRVSSRFGKPYKYYRVAIYTYLLPKESLSGSALTIESRRDHKLRR